MQEVSERERPREYSHGRFSVSAPPSGKDLSLSLVIKKLITVLQLAQTLKPIQARKTNGTRYHYRSGRISARPRLAYCQAIAIQVGRSNADKD
jgi:hypothetical protein